MSRTYILIDFENTQPNAADMSLIRGAHYRVRLFHGPHQNKFDADMVKALQPLGVNLEYFQCERKGKNALDFYIAFYLGRLIQECEDTAVSESKKCRIVVVSKDSGFDALLGHLKTLGYDTKRVASVGEALSLGEPTDVADVRKATTRTRQPPRKAALVESATHAAEPSAPKVAPEKKVAKAATLPPRRPQNLILGYGYSRISASILKTGQLRCGHWNAISLQCSEMEPLRQR